MRRICVSWIPEYKLYHAFEGGIVKYVPRITVWHCEACRVMANGDPEGQILLSKLKQIMDYFSCSPLTLFLNKHPEVYEYAGMQFH